MIAKPHPTQNSLKESSDRLVKCEERTAAGEDEQKSISECLQTTWMKTMENGITMRLYSIDRPNRSECSYERWLELSWDRKRDYGSMFYWKICRLYLTLSPKRKERQLQRTGTATWQEKAMSEKHQVTPTRQMRRWSILHPSQWKTAQDGHEG